VAHGTRDPLGPPAVDLLMAQVARSLPDVRVHTSYVELVDPAVHDVMQSLVEPAVMVPLLLSTGYHVKHDLPRAAGLSAVPVHLAAPLGPDLVIAGALVARLREAGAEPTDAVVLAAAGSTDPDGVADVESAARLLASCWDGPVSAAYVTAATPLVDDGVAQWRARGHERVFVAPYLLAPGRFAAVVRARGLSAGATGVSEVLGDHPRVVDVVRRRYLQGAERAVRGQTTAA